MPLHRFRQLYSQFVTYNLYHKDVKMGQISLEELLNKTGNIYEAVVVLSKRARQVTDIQKRKIENEMDVVPIMDNRDSEDFDEVEIDREALARDYVKYPKATRVALQEMEDGDIEYYYRDTDEKS